MKSTFTLMTALLVAATSFGQSKQQPITLTKSDLQPVELSSSSEQTIGKTDLRLLRSAMENRVSYASSKDPNSSKYSMTEIPLNLFSRGGGGTQCELDEGFETSVPPAGWTLTPFNTAETWNQVGAPTLTASEGSFGALIFYDPALNFQWEILETAPVNLSLMNNPVLTFDWLASYEWAVSPNDNYDLTVSISTNNGGSWTQIWFEEDEGVFTNFVWATKTIDLSAYGASTNALFQFTYIGSDGDAAALDAVSICGTVAGAPCTSAANTYTDLNTAGGAPCFDGAQCLTTDPAFAGIGIYGSEAYLLDNVQAGFDYVFDMCSGFGAGSWIPEITILAPDGTTIDAENTASGTSGLTHGAQCTLGWTASQTGTYTIFINEMGTALGNAPNQVDCFTSYTVDNGNPTVTCGANPFICAPCDPSTLTSALTQVVCPGDTGVLSLAGVPLSPGDFSIGFAPGAGSSGGNPLGFTVTGFEAIDFPYGFDNDLNGVLSFNGLDTLLGTWNVTIYATLPGGGFCDSTGVTMVTFLSATDPACSSGPCTEVSASSNGGIPWADLDLNGGAPCFDGTQCWTTDPNFSGIGIYGSEGYYLSNVVAGFDYVFEMCSGFGAGSWIPEITIIAADGTTIDADNAASGTSGLTHGQQCSLAWTATQSGQYTIIINEMGTSMGNAPSQANCSSLLAIDNGNPTVTCGQNPAPCPPCEAGMISSATTQGVCPGETLDIALSGNNSPDTYTVSFTAGAGASGGNINGLNITEYTALDFPLSYDSDLNGVLSANQLDPLLGTWTVTVFSVNSGFDCDSTTNTISVTFYTANDPACITSIGDDSSSEFMLFPNPTQGIFTLVANEVSGNTTVNVMDVAGKLIYTESQFVGNGFRKTYDLNVAAGTYIVQLVGENGISTRKLTIE